MLNYKVLQGVAGGFFVVFVIVVLLGLFLLPILFWRGRLRKRGYPGIEAYLRELPQTDQEKFDAVELTLKGAVFCLLGLLFPPMILIGVVALYYGGRKLAAMKLGITGAEDGVHDGRSQ